MLRMLCDYIEDGVPVLHDESGVAEVKDGLIYLRELKGKCT